jgi:hypothetical protein
MEGKVDDAGAFCAALADRVVGKKWRSEKESSLEALSLLKVACDIVEAGMEDLPEEVQEELRGDILRALGGVPRSQQRHPKVKKLQKDIMRALNTM